MSLRSVWRNMIYLGFFTCHTLWAAAIQITPVKIFFKPNQAIETLKIDNYDAIPVVLQLDVKAWQQDSQGQDIYQDTTDLLVTPPLFTLPPGQSQLIRIAIVKEIPFLQENSYRLIVREVVMKDEHSHTDQNLRLTLQTLLPIFIGNNSNTPPSYTWTIEQMPNQKSVLKITNTGQQHFLITELGFIDTQDQPILHIKPLFFYLLPHTTKTISLDSSKTLPHNAKLILQTNR